jgi:hypothetical protein
MQLLIGSKTSAGASLLHFFQSFTTFSHSLVLPSAIAVQLGAVEMLQEQSMLNRAASAQKDADVILKALRNIISLCDIFQVNFLSYWH